MTMTQCPGVLDVMGGIGEDSGSLVLTATMAMSFLVSAWQTAQAGVRLRLLIEGGQGPSHDFFLPPELLGPRSDAAAIMDRCRHADCEWAAPSCLVLQEAVSESLISPPAKGLMILLQTDFPTDADFGRHGVQAAATLDALCKLFSHQADRLQQSRACAAAVAPVTGLCSVRTAMTALCAPPGGALLQLRFHTPLVCQPLELPPGIMVLGARTRLTRPTSADRLIETCTCTEMGRRMIIDLQRRDGEAVNEAAARLSAISPTEYVERYRDRLPSKITGKAFVAKFGALRGLNGQLDPDEVYKVRSRAEHHIYENRRVQEFAAGITRARRTGSVEALAQAGELMYASHWSHSQRCGIGGVEPDQLVAGIRKHGHAAGLFGAKVTAGGAGGELVVLMRDNAQARAALADAIAKAEAASEHRIHTWRGWLAGADYFHPPKLEDVAAAVGAA
jgi:L-arabinokinase